jgi:hypothetical protein
MLARAPLRQNRPRQRVASVGTFAAPTGGWDSSSPLAAIPKDRAVQLKNWFPTPSDVEVRKGWARHGWDIGSNVVVISSVNTGTDTLTSNAHGLTDGENVKVYGADVPAGLATNRDYYVITSATNTFQLALTSGGAAIDITGAGSGTIYVYAVPDTDIVKSLMVWDGQSTSKMIAAAGGAWWDVSNRASAFPIATGFTDDLWQHVLFVNSSATYLYAVNGSDSARHYNGTTVATPSITGITSSDAIQINVHKNRIWFVLKNSTKAAYLDVDAIAGAATTFELGSVFTKGSYLMAMATWTRDGGAGADDFAVFISNRGQVALYQGTDVATDFALVGVFDCPPPIGRRCFTQYGSDVLLNTLTGVFPLSQLLSVDQSQSRGVAISSNINSAFNIAAKSYLTNDGWSLCVYPKGTRLIVNIPTSEFSTAIQYVMNTLTGAWCEFDGHNAVCWAVFNNELYFGGVDGTVYRADTGSADGDTPIVAVGQTTYQSFSNPGTQKRFTMLQPLVTSSGANRPALGISTDFVETSELSTTSAEQSAGTATWDTSLWDSFSWGGGVSQINDWVSIPAVGRFASVKFQGTTGVQSGRSLWGVSLWGVSLWGGQATQEQVLKINGFVTTYETGDFL